MGIAPSLASNPTVVGPVVRRLFEDEILQEIKSSAAGSWFTSQPFLRSIFYFRELESILIRCHQNLGIFCRAMETLDLLVPHISTRSNTILETIVRILRNFWFFSRSVDVRRICGVCQQLGCEQESCRLEERVNEEFTIDEGRLFWEPGWMPASCLHKDVEGFLDELREIRFWIPGVAMLETGEILMDIYSDLEVLRCELLIFHYGSLFNEQIFPRLHIYFGREVREVVKAKKLIEKNTIIVGPSTLCRKCNLLGIVEEHGWCPNRCEAEWRTSLKSSRWQILHQSLTSELLELKGD